MKRPVVSVFWIFACLLVLVTAPINFANSGQPEQGSKLVECLVCGKVHENGKNIVEYKQMKIRLCSVGCEEHFRTAEETGKLDQLTAKLSQGPHYFRQTRTRKRT